ncbi:methyltransferase domain-containing protein [Candidatus Phyllobacterium onerii]|uniref:methyltransferase domain-containing protein n=1 Tax=Candidatus Phyllobacterium onerii TaxID=3020828 RepID=UPI002330E9CC|nr:methyltransferase domain-containing protein [Phyllobacterium sp. IY22]
MTYIRSLVRGFATTATPTLRHLSTERLLRHWHEFGVKEGRSASPYALRENFVPLIRETNNILEIGPFFRPIIAGEGVRYFDVLDQAQLRERAAIFGEPIDQIPAMDWVSPTGDLSIVDQKFDAVVSSHCIEHQPDLIDHLEKVADLLDPGGRYFLIIPDKRYCFDHFIPETTVEKVNAARGRKVHTLLSLIEHRAFTTHNDAARHWAGDHSDPGHWGSIHQRTATALREYEEAAGNYIDVHAWQFTPDSFSKVMTDLFEARQIPLRLEDAYPTPQGRLEFCAVLTR